MAERIHIAGHVVRVGDRLRQRCAWCEHVLIDEDLENVATSDGQPPGTWETGALIAVDGPGSWVVHLAPGEPLPLRACANQPVELKVVPNG